ncbi:MAG: helix-turn-helix domain-containing protein [Propionibacteriales bacterium]|nr:helix-turn-helix domain-containing protein [Propionibacteriales bacterium]
MTGRDRLRELLDAVLDEQHGSLSDMAEGAHASRFHFSRLLGHSTGESPAALRRRVMLERAAWQIASGTSVTEAAFAAGYESVEGFSRAYARAYGHPPSSTPALPNPASTRPPTHWLPAPNGVHFHPPVNLWIGDGHRQPSTPQIAAHLIHHDVDDTEMLIKVAGALPDEEFERVRMPGHRVLEWEGPEESIAAMLNALVRSKEVWLAAVSGDEFPTVIDRSRSALAERAAVVHPPWLALLADVERRDAWHDRIVDALCDPPESFALGHIVAHVITYAAHRRQLVRHLLRTAGVEVDDGDPIMWLRAPTITTGNPSTQGES